MSRPLCDGLVHFVVADPRGPIKQGPARVESAGVPGCPDQTLCSGNRLRVPCQPGRTTLSKGVGRGKAFRLVELFHATAQLYHTVRGPGGEERRLELVTCPRCKASSYYRRAVDQYDGG